MLLGQGLNALVSLLMMPYLARSFSKIEYANYGQTLLVTLTVVSLLAAIFNKSLYVFLSNQPRDQDEVISGNLIWSFTISAAIAICLFIAAEPIALAFENLVIKDLIRLYCWAIPALVIYSILNNLLIFQGNVKASSGISVLSNFFKLILLFIAIHYYRSIPLVFIVLGGMACLQVIAVYLATKRSWKFKWKGTWDLGKEQAKLGIPLGLSAIMGTLILQSDGLMISFMMNQESYSIYRNGAWEVPLISTVYASISTILLPEINTLWAKKDKSEIIRLKSIAISNTAALTIPILVLIILNSRSIIEILFSTEYTASWPIFAIFNMALLIRITDYSDVIVSSGNTPLIGRYYLISLIINLTLNVVLISLYGTIGAAVATILSIATLAGLQALKTVKLLETSFFELFRVSSLALIALFSLLVFAVTWSINQLIGWSGLPALLFQGSLYFCTVYLILIRRSLIHPLILEKLKLSRLAK
jgi:O-antigen/teichoic acid export membrane protein